MQKLNLPKDFTSRPITLEDAKEITDLFNLNSYEMAGINEFFVEGTINNWEMPGFNLETESRKVLNSDRNIIAACEVWAVAETPVHPFVWVRVHPNYRGKGLGTALTGWGENRAKKVFDLVPSDARVIMRSSTIDGFPPAKELLENLGMTVTRYDFDMKIEMNAQPELAKWPEGIIVDTFQYPNEEQFKAIYLADAEAFQDHFGFVPEDPVKGFERFKHHFIGAKETFDPDIWFLAMDGKEIAGICLCRKWSHEDKEMGWVSSLGVRRKWRRRGIGKALLQHCFLAYWQRGFKKVGLGVDADSLTGALSLYKSVGMKVIRRYDSFTKELRAGKDLSTVEVSD